jgi:hypothetical protein
MINLVTSFFNKNDSNYNERNKEFITALSNNLSCDYFEKIHLFIDDKYSESILDTIIKKENKVNKVTKIFLKKQPTYQDFLKYANDNLKNKIVMVSNSDIYLSKCDNNLIEKCICQKNNIFALTRFENENYKPLIDKYQGSHDSFIFKSPINYNIIEQSNFVQNVWGSENVLIWLFHKHNYKILNPCNQIKIIHVHKSDVRPQDRIRINNKEYMKDYQTIMVCPITI